MYTYHFIRATSRHERYGPAAKMCNAEGYEMVRAASAFRAGAQAGNAQPLHAGEWLRTASLGDAGRGLVSAPRRRAPPRGRWLGTAATEREARARGVYARGGGRRPPQSWQRRTTAGQSAALHPTRIFDAKEELKLGVSDRKRFDAGGYGSVSQPQRQTRRSLKLTNYVGDTLLGVIAGGKRVRPAGADCQLYYWNSV